MYSIASLFPGVVVARREMSICMAVRGPSIALSLTC
jgi:hypothetical protein